MEFKFTALSFTSPDKVKFRWRLKGLETNWVNGGNRRSVSYSFLEAGAYSFEVEACNSDGIWNKDGASADIIVPPHFWETWWFKIAATSFCLLATLGIALIIQRRKYRIRMAGTGTPS